MPSMVLDSFRGGTFERTRLSLDGTVVALPIVFKINVDVGCGQSLAVFLRRLVAPSLIFKFAVDDGFKPVTGPELIRGESVFGSSMFLGNIAFGGDMFEMTRLSLYCAVAALSIVFKLAVGVGCGQSLAVFRRRMVAPLIFKFDPVTGPELIRGESVLDCIIDLLLSTRSFLILSRLSRTSSDLASICRAKLCIFIAERMAIMKSTPQVNDLHEL